MSVSILCAETGGGKDRPVQVLWVSVSLESITPGQGVRAHFTDEETEVTQGQKGQWRGLGTRLLSLMCRPYPLPQPHPPHWLLTDPKSFPQAAG